MNKHRIWENGTVRAINSNTRKVNRLFLKQQSRKQCLRVVIVERASSNGKSIFLKNRLAVSDWCRIYFVGMGDFWWRCLFRFFQGRKISSWRSCRLNHSKKLSFSDSQASYVDYSVDLKPTHGCRMKKCKEQWGSCPESAPETRSYHTRDFLEVRDKKS